MMERASETPNGVSMYIPKSVIQLRMIAQTYRRHVKYYDTKDMIIVLKNGHQITFRSEEHVLWGINNYFE